MNEAQRLGLDQVDLDDSDPSRPGPWFRRFDGKVRLNSPGPRAMHIEHIDGRQSAVARPETVRATFSRSQGRIIENG